MQTFLTQQIDNNKEPYAQLVRVEGELIAVQKAVADAEKLLKELDEGMQVEKVEACRMGEEKEAAEAKFKDADTGERPIKGAGGAPG